MECLVLFPLNIITNGTLSALLRGARTNSCGALPAFAMIKLRDGASVQCKVKWARRHTSNHRSLSLCAHAHMFIRTHFTFALITFLLSFFTDSSCEHFWESNQELRACYQFNLYTILTWSQALSTCQAQGGNLLSITSVAEHKYIRGGRLLENACRSHRAAERNKHPCTCKNSLSWVYCQILAHLTQTPTPHLPLKSPLHLY